MSTAPKRPSNNPHGRPRLADDLRRTESTRADLTVAEKEHLRQQAELAGLSEAEFVRRRVLSHRIELPSRVIVDPGAVVAVNELVRQVQGIGNNYNQLLVSVHRGRNVDPSLAAIHDQIGDVLSRADAALRKLTGAA